MLQLFATRICHMQGTIGSSSDLIGQLTLLLNDSLWVIDSIMQTPAWPGVNASDCLRQNFVICKEQPGQAQTSQVSWHFITCMCSFWQQNWIDDCSCFMWIHLVLRSIANNDDERNNTTTTASSSLGLKQSISGVPGMVGSDELIRSCQYPKLFSKLTLTRSTRLRQQKHWTKVVRLL